MSKKIRSQDFVDKPYVINQLSHEGRGISHHGSRPLFIRGALPGETVTIDNVAKKQGVLIANTHTVLDASTDRIDPQCAYTALCGGCSLQHMDTTYQLRHKQATVAEQLAHLAAIDDISFSAPITGAIWGYRRKARFGVRYVAKKDRYLVGFREFNGRFLADIEQCETVVPVVGKQLDKLSDLIGSLSIGKHIPQIEVTQADNATALLIRHLEPFHDQDLLKLVAFAEETAFQVFLQSGGYDTVTRLYPDPGVTAPLYYRLARHDLTLFFQVFDFIQVNAEVNAQLIDQAIAWLALTDTDVVLEGFCGIGNFSLPIAKYAKRVTAIENDTNLLRHAAENARYNGIENVDFVMDDLYRCSNSSSYAGNTQYTKLFLDPPRSGAAPWLPTALSTKPEIIVYVSCHSASFARDAAMIVAAGYTLEKIAIANMFPHTAHVETIAQFTRQE
jgi:23S rRNA (uracil1939-C5)-methyltransferase